MKNENFWHNGHEYIYNNKSIIEETFSVKVKIPHYISVIENVRMIVSTYFVKCSVLYFDPSEYLLRRVAEKCDSSEENKILIQVS